MEELQAANASAQLENMSYEIRPPAILDLDRQSKATAENKENVRPK